MSEPRVAWRRVSRGVLFIGFGVFFFLSTQGALHRGFWIDVLSFWPVCLIALGVRLVFERSKVPAAVLLSPVLILGTLTWVAWRGPQPHSHRWDDLRVERPEGTESWTLRCRLGVVDLDVGTRPLEPGILLEGRHAPGDRGAVSVSDRHDWARVTLRSHRDTWGGVRVFPGPRSGWELDLTEDLPVTLDLGTVLAAGELDLEPIRVERIDLDGALNDLTFRLGPVESDVRIDLEGAFNRVVLVVPEETPVRVSTDGFVNLVDRRSRSERGGPGYRVRSEGAFNRIVVRSE